MSRRWRLALPLTALVAIHLATLVGGFLAPNSAIEQNRDLPWAPPSRLRFVDTDGRLHLRPFVYPLVADSTTPDLYHEDPTNPCRLRFFVRGDNYRLAGLLPTDLHFLGVDPPARLNFLGTDAFGRDIFARTLVGGRVSLFAGLLAATLALGIGTLLGVLAGYFGGRTDAVLMRIVELFLALPWLYLLLAVRAFLPLELSAVASFLLLIGLTGLIGWAKPARLVRGVILSATERPFVTAARSFGATSGHLLRKHVVPQAYSLISTQAAMLIPSYILAEVTLSFLGLGIAEPQPTWGNLLRELGRYHALATSGRIAIPAVPLLATFLFYYALNHRPART
jgi:peptide/nickel transport system permease protein